MSAVDRVRVRLLILLAFCSVHAGTAAAQVGGSISGTVRDQSNGVVPGVNVTATNTALGTISSTVTNGQGLYSFPKLPVARYDITLQIDGFKPQKQTGIQVDADSAVQVNFSSPTIRRRAPRRVSRPATCPCHRC